MSDILIADSVEPKKAKAKRRKLGVLDDVIAESVNEAVQDIVTELTRTEINKYIPKRIDVVRSGTIKQTIDRQHHKFELILKTLSAGVNVYLVGPSGTGKTTLAYNLSKALGLSYTGYSCHRDMSAFDFEGSLSVTTNEYAASKVYHPWKNGGVILFDECDRGSAQAMVCLNAILGNDFFTFPNGETIERHPNCYLIAAANTLGLGGNESFNSANKLDAATLDRFAYIEIGVDSALEYAACGIHDKESEQVDLGLGGFIKPEQWVDFVIKYRSYLKEVGLKQVVITPRASIAGCRLLKDGIGFTHLRDMLLTRHLTEEQKNKVNPWITANRPY